MPKSNRDFLDFLKTISETESRAERLELAKQAIQQAEESEEFADLVDGFVAVRLSTSVPHPTTLYRLFGSEGELLYVGITSLGMKRLKQHAKVQPWWTEVAGAIFKHYGDRESALEDEAHLIRTLRPKYNIQHHPPPNQRMAKQLVNLFSEMKSKG